MDSITLLQCAVSQANEGVAYYMEYEERMKEMRSRLSPTALGQEDYRTLFMALSDSIGTCREMQGAYRKILFDRRGY